MGKLIGFTIVMVFIIYTFLAIYNLNLNSFAIEDVKYSISLSAKALASCVQPTSIDLSGDSRGFDISSYKNEVIVDKGRLLTEFYDILYSNYYNEEVFNKIKNNIIIKMLVYENKFYVADVNDKWSPPYFFTTEAGGDIVYLNSANDVVYSYNASGDIVYSDITSYGISHMEKQQKIIDKVNGIVSQHTFDHFRQNGLKIEIYNPFKADGEYKAKCSGFNVLDGLTFFVVFTEDKRVYLDNREFKYKNYNVVGYTIGF